MWTYRNKPVKEPKGFGFIYKITLLKNVDNYEKGTFYIGKKQLSSNRKKKITQKEKLATKTRKRFTREIKESNWKDYWSSSKEINSLIQKHGQDIFKREIICFCPTKYHLSFTEIEQMILHQVHKKKSFNGTIGRYFINKLK